MRVDAVTSPSQQFFKSPMKRRDFLTASTAVAAGATLRTMPSLAQSQPANSTNIELDSNPLFKAWRDPVTGVTSYILEKRVAPHQQGFYFTSPSLTPDARYLWFYCAFPPSGSANLGRSLGVADLQKGTMRHFPETEFSDGSPMVDPLNGEVYWCNNLDVWKRGPDEGQDAVWINSFPKALAKGRRPYRLATHLTSALGSQEFQHRRADRQRMVHRRTSARWWAVRAVAKTRPLLQSRAVFADRSRRAVRGRRLVV